MQDPYGPVFLRSFNFKDQKTKTAVQSFAVLVRSSPGLFASLGTGPSNTNHINKIFGCFEGLVLGLQVDDPGVRSIIIKKGDKIFIPGV